MSNRCGPITTGHRLVSVRISGYRFFNAKVHGGILLTHYSSADAMK
jgi:hypothetical protein